VSWGILIERLFFACVVFVCDSLHGKFLSTAKQTALSNVSFSHRQIPFAALNKEPRAQAQVASKRGDRTAEAEA
jgi:hypothetical protein